jgi:hypothetical protein
MAGLCGIRWTGLLVAVLVVGARPAAVAQEKTAGSLTGKLTDSYSTPLGKALVTVRNDVTGTEARTITSKNGVYRFTGLGAGEYTLEAESRELGHGRVDGIVVSAGHEARVQAALQLELPRPGPIVAAFHDISPAATVVTTTLPAEQMEELPLTGRRWQDFALDTPTASTPAGGEAQTSLRGAGESAAVTVDGANRTLAFGAAGGGGQAGQAEGSEMGSAWAQGRGASVGGPAMSQTSIRSVQMAAGNVEAEAGRAAGGALNMETLRGANGLHGQGFVFDRQNSWDAKNPFTTWVKEAAPATEIATPVFTAVPYSPPDHEMTWGFGVGGRIRRDKLFWFGAVGGYQRNDPGVAMVKHPYLLQNVSGCLITPENPCTQMTGFFAQPSPDQMQVLCARLGLTVNGIDGARGYCPLAKVTTAYSNMLETLDSLLGPAPRTAQQWVGFGRIDWEAAERHHFTLEGTGALWNSPGGGLTRVSETYGNHSFGNSHASEEWVLGRWEAFLTPNLLAVTQGTWGRNILSERPGVPSELETTLLTQDANTPVFNVWGQLPQIVVDNRYGFTIGNPSGFGAGSYPDERLYEGQESLDWVHGGLLVKAGFDVGHNSDATSMLRNQTGTYNYASVENFVSDALVFGKFGLAGELDPYNQHDCDQTGTVWVDPTGTPRGLGALPCYSYYSQILGPSAWQLSTNDWAGFATTQWQPKKLLVLSLGLRWEREQLPPPISALANFDPTLTGKATGLPPLPMLGRLPSLGNNWGPRASLALGSAERHWPVLYVGYGMYFGRTKNSTVETALTQTGSPKGDLSFFIRPTDGLNTINGTSDAQPFPDVLDGDPASEIRPGVVGFAPNFRNPEVHQGVVAIDQTLPGHLVMNASALMSLGRRLPISIDENLDPKAAGTITYNVCDPAPPPPGGSATECGFTGLGPIKTPQVTVPFYASWPTANGLSTRPYANYQQITAITDRANSTYEAAMIKITRYGRRGLSLHAHYTYSHAMDWNPNESTLVASSDVLAPADLSQEYGTSNLDVRHSAAILAIWETPWKPRRWTAHLANGWMVSGIGQFHSGLPYTMRTAGSLPECIVSPGITSCSPPAGTHATTGDAIVGLGPGMNGSGGDNRVYGIGDGGLIYNIGRNTFRYPAMWKADLRMSKSFDLGHLRELQLMAESFNLFNHQNVTELETTGYYIGSGSATSPPTLSFLTGLKPNTTAFGQPLNINGSNFYRERQIQVGLRMRF